MFGWSRKSAPAGRLERLLAGYSPCPPVHIGVNIRISGEKAPTLGAEQLRENFEAYRNAVPDRLTKLRPLLAALGVDMDTAYTDPVAFVHRLHPMLLAELPSLYHPELGKHVDWELSDRSGNAIVLTFLADLAMLEADLLIRAKPGAFLGQNLDPGDRNMFSYRRPCLLGLGDSLYPDAPPSIYYIEEEWFGAYSNMDRPERLASAEFTPAQYPRVMGGSILMRLERDIPHPKLNELKRDTWLGQAG